MDIAHEQGLKKVLIHPLSDRSDTDPKSGLGFVKGLEEAIANKSAQIASVCGRYYTMDRDKRWERVKIGYDLLTQGKGEAFKSAEMAMETSYSKGITDEFIKLAV